MANIMIVDYGMANLRSVQKAFERIGRIGRNQQRPGSNRDRGETGAPGRRRFGTPSPNCGNRISTSQSLTISNRGCPFWGSVWACSCCSAAVTKMEFTRA